MRLVLLNTKKKAQSLIEYALILAMVAVVAIAALQLLGNNIGGALRGAADTVGTGAQNAGRNACEAMGEGFTWKEDASSAAGGTCEYQDGGSSSTDTGSGT